MRQLILIHCLSREQWEVYELDDKRIVHINSEAEGGGFTVMYDNINQAQLDGWEILDEQEI